jgi:hypothetical protein
LGVLDRGERDKDNEIALEEGGVLEMSTTVLHSRAAPSLKYSPETSPTTCIFDNAWPPFAIDLSGAPFIGCQKKRMNKKTQRIDKKVKR